jgi:hypothetical protein
MSLDTIKPVCSTNLTITITVADFNKGYGYSTAEDLHDVVDNYRQVGIPLDGIHADVDFQVTSSFLFTIGPV